MRWWVKAAIAGTCAHFPGGVSVYDRIRKRFGELAKFEDADGFRNAVWFLETVRRHCGRVQKLKVIEFGTGWVPAVPFGCALAGMEMLTVDVACLVESGIFERFLDEAQRYLPELADAAGVEEQVMASRMETARQTAGFDQAMQALGCAWQAPVDTTRLVEIPDDHGDLTISNLVLQCIPKQIVPHVIAELYRVTRPGGFSIHRMTMFDEYSTSDPARNDLDYLRISEPRWNRWFSHRIKHLNRLRYSQFLELLRAPGFEVVDCSRDIDRDSIPHLQQHGVAREFESLSWDDIATTTMQVVLRRPDECEERDSRSRSSVIPIQSLSASSPAMIHSDRSH